MATLTVSNRPTNSGREQDVVELGQRQSALEQPSSRGADARLDEMSSSETEPPQSQQTSAKKLKARTDARVTKTEAQDTVKRQRRPGPCRWWNEWWIELATWAFGTMSIAAILILLGLFNTQLIEHWHSDVSINTMISVLSQAAVSSLMLSVSSCVGQLKWTWYRKSRALSYLEYIDDASRGPLGSFVLLWKFRPGLGLASLGAFVTISILTFPPFVQQAVKKTPVRWESVSTTGKINRGISVRLSNWKGLDWKEQIGDFTGLLPLSFKEAIATGLSANNTDLSQLSASCPTSNCTWAPYQTLSICASFENVTTSIIKTCSDIPDADDPSEYPCNVTIEQIKSFHDTEGHISGWWDFAYQNWKRVDPGGAGTAKNMWIQAIPPLSVYDAMVHQGSTIDELKIVDVYVLYNTNILNLFECWDTHGYTASCSIDELTAVRATLRMCVDTLETDVVNGTTTTRLTNRTDKIKWKSTSIGPFTAAESMWHAYPNNNNAAQYTVNLDTFAALSDYLIAEVFIGNASMLRNDNVTSADVSSDAARSLSTDMWGPLFNENSSSYAMTGFQNRINNVSVALTNSIRSLAQPYPNATVTGHAWTQKPYIEVDYRWLIVPLTLYVLITTLLCMTIWLSERRRMPLWKSSPLALIKSQHREGVAGPVSAIHEESKSIYVRMEQRGDTWRLERTV